MSNRGSSWITLKFRGVVDVIRASRYQSSYVALQRNRPIVSAARTERGYWMHPGQQFYSNNTSTNPKGYLLTTFILLSSSINSYLSVEFYVLKFVFDLYL